MEKKLFLLDAYALIFRAYYAFISNPMTNSKGMPTSTVFGFTLALEEILRKEDPTHIAVVFDPPGPTFRHDMFPEYKAHRDATPEDIKAAVPYIKKLIEGFNIPVIEEAGFEADDVIGTIAKLAEEEFASLEEKLSHDNLKDLETFEKEIRQILTEEIVNRYYYQAGRILSQIQEDSQLDKAREILNEPGMLKEVLNGNQGALAKAVAEDPRP